MLKAAGVGVRRKLKNLRIGRQEWYGNSTDENWQQQIEGAMAELVIAKFMRYDWSGLGEPGQPDVGPDDVRHTSYSRGCLLLHLGDKDDRVFWLVTGGYGQYQVRGWIVARDGKQERWWRDPKGGRPCFFVPQAHLIDPLLRVAA